MRILDFFLFYLTEFRLRLEVDSVPWESAARRTGSFVGLLISLWILAFAEIIAFFFFNKEIFDSEITVLVFTATAISIIQLLRYIYIARKRYIYITSSEYLSFTMPKRKALAICAVFAFTSMLLPFGAGILTVELSK